MRTSSIRLRANARLAILHEDFLEICDGNMLAAMLLSILVYWTDVKIAKKDENLWIWKSHEDFQEDLMFDKPGMKPPHRTTISCALDLLSGKKFIDWRKNPKIALDRTRQYLVNLEEVQTAINKLPVIECRKSDIPMLENRLSEEQATEADLDVSSNVGKPTMQSRKSNNALSEFQQCIVGKPTSNTNDYSTEITDPEITEQREREVVAAAPTAPAEISSQEIDPEKTEERPIVKPPQRENTNVVQKPQKPPANKPTIPKHITQRGLMDTKPVESEPIPEKALEILARWDSISKKPTPRTPEMIKDAILFMAVDPTAEEMKGCRAWLFTTDDPKRPWYRKIGVGFHDVVKNFSKWQSIQEMQPAKPPGKEESNEHRVSSFGTPGFNFADEFYPSEAEKKAYYAAHPIGVTK